MHTKYACSHPDACFPTTDLTFVILNLFFFSAAHKLWNLTRREWWFGSALTPLITFAGFIKRSHWRTLSSQVGLECCSTGSKSWRRGGALEHLISTSGFLFFHLIKFSSRNNEVQTTRQQEVEARQRKETRRGRRSDSWRARMEHPMRRRLSYIPPCCCGCEKCTVSCNSASAFITDRLPDTQSWRRGLREWFCVSNLGSNP